MYIYPTPRLHSLGESRNDEFAIACFGWWGGFDHPNLPFPWEPMTQSNTMCPWTPQV